MELGSEPNELGSEEEHWIDSFSSLSLSLSGFSLSLYISSIVGTVRPGFLRRSEEE